MKHVIVTDSEIDGLGHDAKNVHQLPDAGSLAVNL